MIAFRHPLVDALGGDADLRDRVPFILPFELRGWPDSPKVLGRRPCLLVRDHAAELDALKAANRSFIAALAGGLQVPGDLLEKLLVRRSIGRIGYELAEAEAAFVVTRRFELVDEYRAFMAAMAGNLAGWHPVDNDAAGDLAHAFPLWAHAGPAA
ncbi:hypothetical protein PYV00_24170 [Novosphingobium sp. H3SJ31-1]|uniref:Uncharacterized protein n=2 Tax=Novosphingobium album (ex Liu et al. 2023) TaxID=3031130 RepID=A0ABT5WXZ0_9SPHN|nr:hypothetical protein [Novosphingobium album (ex Liu et al. 2023)]